MSRLSRSIVSAVGTCIWPILASGVDTSVEKQNTAAMYARIQQLEQELQQLKHEFTAMQASEPTVSPAAAEAGSEAENGPSKLASLLGPTSLSGFVDMYYLQNFNNPDPRTNGLRSFDNTSNQFGLNLVELVVDKTPNPDNSRTGYHLALGYGNAMNAIYASAPVPFAPDQYLKEAYFSYLAPVGKGLQFDFGKFVTPLGAEVIESKDNWNYSRGLLFSYAIPYFHFGMRTKYAFNDKFSLTGYFTNGWNNVIDNNSAKTYGASFTWSPSKKVTVAQNFMIGPEQTDNSSNWRQIWDTVVTVSPTKRLTLMANYDYGRGDRITGIASPVWWTGIAGYVKYAISEKYAVAGRYEYYNDHYGFTTGTAGHVNGVTGTFERPIGVHFISRLEFRHDIANNPIFTKGTSTPVNSQTTATAGLIYVFDSREGAK